MCYHVSPELQVPALVVALYNPGKCTHLKVNIYKIFPKSMHENVYKPKSFKSLPKGERAFLLPCVVLKSHHVCLYHLQLKFCRKTHLDVCWALVQSLEQGRHLFPEPKVNS